VFLCACRVGKGLWFKKKKSPPREEAEGLIGCRSDGVPSSQAPKLPGNDGRNAVS
jgi:hypothetical protein